MSDRREHTIEMVKRRRLRKSMPRLQVTLILLLTGFTGFLASFSLLHVRVELVWLRYPIRHPVGLLRFFAAAPALAIATAPS